MTTNTAANTNTEEISAVGVALSPEAAVESLQEILPTLEQECEDARRCFSVIAENFHAANSRLQAMLRAGKTDDSVHEFLYAANEISKNLAPVLETVRQLEAATNEFVKGAQSLPKS